VNAPNSFHPVGPGVADGRGVCVQLSPKSLRVKYESARRAESLASRRAAQALVEIELRARYAGVPLPAADFSILVVV